MGNWILVDSDTGETVDDNIILSSYFRRKDEERRRQEDLQHERDEADKALKEKTQRIERQVDLIIKSIEARI